MKKICLFLFITCIISIHNMEARSVMEGIHEPVQTTYNIDQSDSDVLINILENMGFEIEKLEVLEEDADKKCTITVKGKFNGQEIEVVVTIEGMTCKEVLKALKEK